MVSGVDVSAMVSGRMWRLRDVIHHSVADEIGNGLLPPKMALMICD